MKKRIDWTKGLTRIYLLLVFVWALYCIYWVPMEQVESWQTLASLTQDETKRSEYLSHANLIAQWKVLAGSPIISLAMLVIPPILGYGLLRLAIFITRWVFKGFQHDN